MGWPIGDFVCTACAFSQPGIAGPYPRVYLLDQGSLLPMRTHYVWCADCDRLCQAEDLSLSGPLHALRRTARLLRSVTRRRSWFRTVWSSLSLHWLDDDLNARHELHPDGVHQLGEDIDTFSQQVAYLAARSAPAACLSCGGHRLTVLERVDTDSGRAYMHPACGGMLVYRQAGSMNLCPGRLRHVHDAQGRYLRTEENTGAPQPPS